MSSIHPAEIEKRTLEDSSVPTGQSKKRKVESPELATADVSKDKVNSSELASAFALASLASFSPTKKSLGAKSSNVQTSSSFEESRSEEATGTPVTPDQRSPGSPGTSKSSDEAVCTPNSARRRVSFCPSTKDETSSPSSILKSKRSPSRRIVLPIRNPAPVGFGARRMHPGYALSPYRTPPPVPHHHMMISPHSPYHHPPQAWFHGVTGAATLGARNPYPQRLMQPALMHSENQWVCDYCNLASFSTYKDACAHEETCKHRFANGFAHKSPVPGPHSGIHQAMSRSASGDEEASMGGSVTSASSETWQTGKLSLAMEESDREWLSELNCFIRSECVEAFSATEDDVSRSSKRGRIALNQVGIRCRFCCASKASDKAVAAVSFPTTIGGIYESVKRWQRVHLESCTEIPSPIKEKLASLANTNVWVPTTRQYWTDSAKAMGLVDTNQGIRFSMSPKEVAERVASSDVAVKLQVIPRGANHASHGVFRQGAQQQPHSLVAPLRMGGMQVPQMPSLNHEHQSTSSPGHVVFQEDIEMIPPYVYFLMRQVEPCRFTEADRFVARSKGPVGYPGFQCRHCSGHAGLGKYFPVSSKSLSTNSTSQNIHAHLLKCRKCPDHIKDQLVQLKIEKGRMPRLEPGWRKIFFDKVWGRMHRSN